MSDFNFNPEWILRALDSALTPWWPLLFVLMVVATYLLDEKP